MTFYRLSSIFCRLSAWFFGLLFSLFFDRLNSRYLFIDLLESNHRGHVEDYLLALVAV